MKMKSYIYSLILICSLFSCSNTDDNPIIEEEEEITITIPPSNTLGALVVTNDAYNGLTLFSSNKNSYLINNCGQVINKWNSNYDRGGDVYLYPDGSILRAGKIDNNDISFGGIGGIIEKFDWEGNLTWSYTYSSSTFSQHHDLQLLPNGNILILALERKTEAEAILAGRDPQFINEGELYTEQVIEIVPMGTNQASIVWEWDAWDHLTQDFDNTKQNYGSVEDNPQLLDINYIPNGVGKRDWLHFNSMQYNEDLDQIIMNSQSLGEFYIIDHSTSMAESSSHSGGNRDKGGDFLYRWGNPRVFKSGSEQDQKLFGAHFPHFIPDIYTDGGKILIFNNGLGRSANFSTVNIINPPLTVNGNYTMSNPGDSFLPNDFDWTYIDPIDPLNFYSRIISSAQRLPNGNTLICEGTRGHFFEIDPSSNVVWRYKNPDAVNGILTQGDAPNGNPVFRAKKYSSNYLNGINLTVSVPIELNFDIGNCQL